jgi:predicted CopG family antitoxin
MTNTFEINEDVYKFLDKIPFEKENVKELIDYVHYKA